MNSENSNPNKVLEKPKLGTEVKLKCSAGHPESQCNGQGACLNNAYTGKWHVPCQGTGKDCEWEFTITIGFETMQYSSDGNSYLYMGITSYNQNEFGAPERSIYIEELSQYLNIPEQVVHKDENGYKFVNVSYTDAPLFEI